MSYKLPGIIISLFMALPLLAGYDVTRVDFLRSLNLKVNAAGPLLVKADPIRNRIILVNTYTSSLSIIDGRDHSVFNVPIKSRIPQYLKDEALQIDTTSGNIYVVGNHMLHVVFPEKKKAFNIDTGDQYEMVAINEKNSNAYLVGRASVFLAMVDLKSRKSRTIRWVDKKESIQNLNQTPPPPIRKVVWDKQNDRVIAVDGMSGICYIFSSSGRLLNKRRLQIENGSRWHFAGFNRKNSSMYCVIENSKREVIEAVKIDVGRRKETVIDLPKFTEAVGVNYNALADEVIIPYDNHPSVHVVSFKNKGNISEIKIPAYGNDASAIDTKNNILYVSSWAYGEINVIDLEQKKLVKRIPNLGILPHMFSMAFNQANNKLYIPIGATAVNGSFGAALTSLDTVSYDVEKIYTGWAPVDLIPLKNRQTVLVFNSEDRFAEVKPDGSFTTRTLPCSYPGQVISSPGGHITLSYGPHQSYWPVVYIWGARNGILGIDPRGFEFYDRRIPRLAQRMVVDKNGVLYALQNNWGREKQFIITLPDAVRSPNLGDMRWELNDWVIRETTQRIFEYDPYTHWLYIVRVGETDSDSGILQILDLDSREVLLRYPVGKTPVDLDFDEQQIGVTNFDANTVTIINKSDFSIKRIKTGEKPLKLIFKGGDVFVINHDEKTLQIFGKEQKKYDIPGLGKPDNLFDNGNELIVTSHSSEVFLIHSFSVKKKAFSLIHEYGYPYGETSVDTNNTAFYVRGQFGDALFDLNQIEKDEKGRIWITDFISGKLFILSK